MESPFEASEMACPMVLHAVWGDLQLLLSFPLTPSTYHVVWAEAAGARARNRTKSSRLLNISLGFIVFLSFLQCASLLRANRSAVQTRPCRSQCHDPPCRDAGSRADPSLVNDHCHQCSHSGCPHQSPGFLGAAHESLSDHRCSSSVPTGA